MRTDPVCRDPPKGSETVVFADVVRFWKLTQNQIPWFQPQISLLGSQRSKELNMVELLFLGKGQLSMCILGMGQN